MLKEYPVKGKHEPLAIPLGNEIPIMFSLSFIVYYLGDFKSVTCNFKVSLLSYFFHLIIVMKIAEILPPRRHNEDG